MRSCPGPRAAAPCPPPDGRRRRRGGMAMRCAAAALMLSSLMAGGCASYQDAVEARMREETAAQSPAEPADPHARFLALADRCAGGDREALSEAAALYQGTLEDRTLGYQDYAAVQAFERCADAVRRRREAEEGQWRAACMVSAGSGRAGTPADEGQTEDAVSAAGGRTPAPAAGHCEEEARRRRRAMQQELAALMRLVVRDEMRCALFARHFYVRGDAVNGAFWLQRLIDLHGAEYAYGLAGRIFLQEPQTAVSGARMLSEAARAGSGEAHQLLQDLIHPGSMAYRRLLGDDSISARAPGAAAAPAAAAQADTAGQSPPPDAAAPAGAGQEQPQPQGQEQADPAGPPPPAAPASRPQAGAAGSQADAATP